LRTTRRQFVERAGSAALASSLASVGIWPRRAFAQDQRVIELPEPVCTGGMPLMDALANRQTIREYSSRDISPQTLANLLWAAFGINRPESGKRTAPSASNLQETDIYVIRKDGAYRWDPALNTLTLVAAGDHRAVTGGQDFVTEAPVNLVYVSDYTRMGDRPQDVKEHYGSIDTGFIAQNVYLFCASEGLANVVRGGQNNEELERVLKLDSDRNVVLKHTIGYPK
jgi:SagB-type dehydrogenase family enzyme